MKIGKRMRTLRKEKNMTLDALSKKSGVALATLSRMENNKMTGTLAAHASICKALGASITELYRNLENEEKTVENISQRKRTEHFVHSNKAKYELLVAKASGKKLLPLILTIGSGGATDQEQDKPGAEKFVYIFAGALEASIGTNTYSLKRGDSLYFDASLPHSFKNILKVQAEAMCIISPPAV